MPEDIGSTHVVYQGKHYELPGRLSREEALLRVQNLTDEDLPKMQSGFGESRELTPEEQAPLDVAEQARRAEFRGEQYSEGYPDVQDWTKLGGGAAFAAAPSVVAGGAGPLLRSTLFARGAAGAEGARQGYESGGVPGAVAGGAFGAAVPTKVSAPTLGAAFGYDVAGVPGAVTGAVTGVGGRGITLLRRALRGGVAGGIAGATPVIGRGVKQGAQLGIADEFGQKGLGALWKHGKQMKEIQWLRRLMGAGDEAAAGGAVPQLPPRLPPGATPTATSADDIAAQVAAARRAESVAGAVPRTPGGASTTSTLPGPAPVPPAPLSAQQAAAAEAATAARAARAATPPGPVGAPVAPPVPAAPPPTIQGAPGAARVAPAPAPAPVAPPAGPAAAGQLPPLPGGARLSGAAPGSPQEIAYRINLLKGQPGVEQAVRQWLSQQAPAFRAEVEALLAGAERGFPTTF